MSRGRSAAPVYMVYQLEVGESGTPHLQGYVHFTEQRSMATVKRLLGYGHVHLERRKGKHSEARAYCMKEDTRRDGPWEYGDSDAVPETQGDNGWEGIIADSKVLREVEMFEKYPEKMIRYFKGVNRYRDLSAPQRDGDVTVFTIVGPSGVGKSYWAMNYSADPYVVPEPKGSGLYFDGYEKHKTMVFDDMTGRFMRQAALLRLLDPYPFKLAVHGGQVECVAETIIFTTNIHPKHWYKEIHGSATWEASPLRRRLTQGESVIYHMDSDHNLRIDCALDGRWELEAPENDENNNNNDEQEVIDLTDIGPEDWE